MQLRRVRATRDGGVHRLTLTGDALTSREAAELAWAAGEIHEDRSVHVVVLDSAGRDFCPGPAADLDLSIDPAGALGALRPPVVAALRGAVGSVGLEIALACDVRVASADAVLAQLNAYNGSTRGAVLELGSDGATDSGRSTGARCPAPAPPPSSTPLWVPRGPSSKGR